VSAAASSDGFYTIEVSSFLDFISFKVEKSYNEETLEAIEEIQQLKKQPNKKTYSSFSELLEEVKADV
jgi:hypothetical protein